MTDPTRRDEYDAAPRMTPRQCELLSAAIAEHADAIRSWARRSFRDPELADDALQDAVFAVARHLAATESSEVERDPAGALWRNARWAAHIRLRRARTDLGARTRLAANAGVPGPDAWKGTEARLLVEQLLDALPETYREVLVDRLNDVGSDIDAAARRGLTVKAYRRRRDRALLAARSLARRLDMLPSGVVGLLAGRARRLQRRIHELAHARPATVIPLLLATLVTGSSGIGTGSGASPPPAGRGRPSAIAVARAIAPTPSPTSMRALETGPPRQRPPASTGATSTSNPPVAGNVVVGAIQAAPHHPEVIVAAQSGGQLLLRSSDGGRTWSRAPGPPTDVDQVLLPPDYPDDPRIFVAQWSAFGFPTYEAAAFGKPFLPIPAPPGNLAAAPDFDAGNPVLYVAGLRGIWTYDVDRSLLRLMVADPAEVDFTGSAVAAPLATGRTSLIALLQADAGILVTGDARAPTTGSLTASVPHPAVVVCTPAGHCDVRGHVPTTCSTALYVSPHFDTDSTLFAACWDALYRSVDGGATWSPVDFPDGLVAQLVFAPGTQHPTVFALADRPGSGATVIDESDDLGVTWRAVTASLPAATTPRLVPAPVSGLHLVVPLLQGGLACTVDGGRSWAAVCPA